MTTIANLVEKLLKLPQDLETLKPDDSDENTFHGVVTVSIHYVEKHASEPYTDIFDEDDLKGIPPEDLESMFKKVAIIWSS